VATGGSTTASVAQSRLDVRHEATQGNTCPAGARMTVNQCPRQPVLTITIQYDGGVLTAGCLCPGSNNDE
jgi:hypothetical protein